MSCCARSVYETTISAMRLSQPSVHAGILYKVTDQLMFLAVFWVVEGSHLLDICRDNSRGASGISVAVCASRDLTLLCRSVACIDCTE